MSNESSLIAQIQFNPHNEQTRLIYADWLEERGDLRAKFIRKEIQYVNTNLKSTEALRLFQELETLISQLNSDWVEQVGYRYDFRIIAYGNQKLESIKIIKWMTGKSLMESKQLADEAPTTLIYAIPFSDVVGMENSQWRRSPPAHFPKASRPEFEYQLSYPDHPGPLSRRWGTEHIRRKPDNSGYNLGEKAGDLFLVAIGENRSATVALIRDLTGFPTPQCIRLVNQTPCRIFANQKHSAREQALTRINYLAISHRCKAVFEYRPGADD